MIYITIGHRSRTLHLHAGDAWEPGCRRATIARANAETRKQLPFDTALLAHLSNEPAKLTSLHLHTQCLNTTQRLYKHTSDLTARRLPSCPPPAPFQIKSIQPTTYRRTSTYPYTSIGPECPCWGRAWETLLLGPVPTYMV